MYVAEGDTPATVGALIAMAAMGIGWWIRKTRGENAEKEFNRILKRASMTFVALITVALALIVWITWGDG